MKLSQFTELLRQLLSADRRPIVAYTGLFSIAREFPPPAESLPQRVLHALLDAVGPKRTLLMPAYTTGFRDGVIDLDATPGNTGMINELLRRMPGTRRTASAFFSFVAKGPEADEVADLRPQYAWGNGSVFDWIERNNAQLVMIGVPWAMCSFLHRVEWVVGVPYRYSKSFEGECVINGRRQPLHERLFVRSLNPLALNTWPNLEEILQAGGMQRAELGRGQIAAMPARSLVDTLVPILRADPFAFVQNADALRTAFRNDLNTMLSRGT